MSVITVYLVVGADRTVRVGKRPRVHLYEVAIPIRLNFPDAWGATLPAVTIEVPGPPSIVEEKSP